jgi:hypothetical protein
MHKAARDRRGRDPKLRHRLAGLREIGIGDSVALKQYN